MATPRAQYIGADAVMEAFDNRKDNNCFSFWVGKDMLYQSTDKDSEAGKQYLEDTLRAGEGNYNTDLYTIKFHVEPKEGGFITDKTPVTGMMYIRCVDVHQPRTAGASPEIRERDRVPNTVYHAMMELQKLPTLLTEQLTAMKAELLELSSKVDAEPDEEYEDEPMGIMGQIGSYLKTPAGQNVVEQYLPAILSRLFGGAAPGQPVFQPRTTVAGTPEQVKEPEPLHITDEQAVEINIALARLAKHLDLATDLKALADYADKNPQMFTMMLTNLRQS